MRGAFIAGLVLLSVAASPAAEYPEVSEARRLREEVASRLAAVAASVSRLSRAMERLGRSSGALPAARIRELAGELARQEGEAFLLAGELSNAERHLASTLRKGADEVLDGIQGEAADLVERLALAESMLREADRLVMMDDRFPPPDHRLASAVSALVAGRGVAADAREADGVLGELQGRLLSLQLAAEREAVTLHRRRKKLLRLGASLRPALVPRYTLLLESQGAFLAARLRDYRKMLASLPPVASR